MGETECEFEWGMLEEVDHFQYLGLQIGREGGMEGDFIFKVREARKTMLEEWKSGNAG